MKKLTFFYSAKMIYNKTKQLMKKNYKTLIGVVVNHKTYTLLFKFEKF